METENNIVVLQNKNINTFSKYITNYKSDFSNKLHILYLITSPQQIYKDTIYNKKNDAIVNAIILIKDHKNEYTFEEVQFSWSSIDLLKSYSYITVKSSLNYLGELEEYRSLFKYEKEIVVDLSRVREITLKEVIYKYHYYNKLPVELIEKYKNERFLVFESNGKEFIIPSIEIVRFFYCYSFGDSLKQAVYHPSGLYHIVKNCEYDTQNKMYDLYLNSICEKNDAQKIFYFMHKKALLEYFNSIFFNYRQFNIVSASFPFLNDFTISFNSYIRYKQNSKSALITRVLNSNMIKKMPKETKVNVYHPSSNISDDKSKIELIKNGNTFCTKRQEEYDDRLSSITTLPTELVQDEDSVNEDMNYININYIQRKVKHIDSENKNTVFQKTGGFSSSSISTKNKAIKVMTSDINTNLDYNNKTLVSDKQIGNTGKVIIEFNKFGFNFINKNTYEFPDCQLYGSFRKKAISYIDNNMSNKRCYNIVKFKKKKEIYYYVDVEKDRNKLGKEIIFFIDIDENLIHQSIYQQVLFGNHRWLSKKNFGLVHNFDFITVKHCKNISNTIRAIVNKINKRRIYE